MTADILGYAAYILIGLFYPLQLFFMFRGRNVNLGSWPLVSLTAGLIALQASFFFVTVPAYVFFGNLVNTVFAVVNLFYVLRKRPQRVSDGSTLAKYAEKMLSLSIPPVRRPRKNPFTESVNFCNAEPSDALRLNDFAPCETCGCSLLLRDASQVETVVHSASRMVAGGRLPRHEDVLPTTIAFYCKRDKPAYERVVITPGINNGVVTTAVGRDYYVRNRVPMYSDDNACAYIGDRVDGWRQVTEDGEQFD